MSTPASPTNAPAFTVSELAGAIKRSLEDGFGQVRLRGEVSGFKGAHASGHCYFALKDDKAKIEAVVWRGVLSRLKVKPEEGLEVVVQGRVTTFPNSSKYQIVIEAMEPAGVGALMALLEERKKRLAAEGLFADARKRPLPFLPAVIGVVTSPTGAVIRDIARCVEQRFPTRVLVWPVRVQGETSAAEVTAAIQGFNALSPNGPIPRPDVLIVARGGGSLEDLWGFNEESVARAAAGSAIPLIAAVGHETDWTLIDLAADRRASTPTMAAEWAVPKRADLAAQVGEFGLRLGRAVRRFTTQIRAHWKAAARGLPRLDELLASPRQRFDAAERRLARALLANTRGHITRQARLAARLHPRLLANRLARARDRLDGNARRATSGLAQLAAARRGRFERAAGRLRPAPLAQRVERRRERLAALDARARQCLSHHVSRARRRLDGQADLLRSLSYQGVLRRGFAVVRDVRGGMVRLAARVAPRERLEIEFADGRVPVEAREASADRERPSERPEPASKPRGPGQGSLF